MELKSKGFTEPPSEKSDPQLLHPVQQRHVQVKQEHKHIMESIHKDKTEAGFQAKARGKLLDELQRHHLYPGSW